MLTLVNSLIGSNSIIRNRRSAYFDGTGDYIDTGDTFQQTLRSDFSWSLWVKPDDGQPGSDMDILGAENSSGDDKIYIRLATTGKIWLIHESNSDDATYQTANAVFPNGACDWTHIAVRVQYTDGGADTSYNIYVNGYVVNGTLTNAVTHGNHADYTSDISFFIGGRNNNGSLGNAFAGYIDEVALFVSHLSGAEIAAIYNSGRPFNLMNDRGDYDQSSNLRAYWKMFDGLFDDRVNGIVHDQHNPGYGSEIVANGGFDSDLTSWSTGGVSGGNTISQADGKVVLTADGSTGLRLYQTSVFTTGSVYRVEFDAYDITGAGFKIQSGDNENIGPILSDKHYVFYHTATNTTLNIYRRTGSSASSGKLDNISVKKLNGFPAIASGNATFKSENAHRQTMSSVATLDGVGDYLDVGNVLDFGGDDFSVSAWIKANDLTHFPIITKYVDTDNVWRLVVGSDDKIAWLAKADGNETGSGSGATALTALQDSWIHVCVSGDRDGSYAIYINGATSTYGKTAASMANSGQNIDNSGPIYIGRYEAYSGNQYATGWIDEVAIWNVALDADAVAAIHTAGRNYDLTADTGNYDNSSALQAYWKMSDGKGDHAEKGFIADQANVGFGSELWDATQGDDANWALNLSGTNTKAEVDGSVQFTYVDNATGGYIYLNDSKDLSTDLTVEAVYRCTFETKTNTGTSNWHINDGAASGSVNYTSGNVTTEWQTKNIYFKAKHTQNAYLMLTNMGSGEVTLIKNISLKKANGYPAITINDATTIRQPV